MGKMISNRLTWLFLFQHCIRSAGYAVASAVIEIEMTLSKANHSMLQPRKTWMRNEQA